MHVDVLLGLQWGDEGKGKIVDYLAPRYDLIARFQGGPNAGHTLVVDGRRIVLHTLPSGMLQDRPLNLIGNGVVINPVTLRKEIEELEGLGVDVQQKLRIAKRACLILPTHEALDAASERAKGASKIGSTLRGIGPAYMDKTGRNAVRVGDALRDDFMELYSRLRDKHLGMLKAIYDEEVDVAQEEQAWMESLEFLKRYTFVQGEYFVNGMLEAGKPVLAEGAQGSMLDIDFGTYPFVTSSNTISASACKGLGVAPQYIREVIGISKAYCTRVGSGPFPTELTGDAGEALRKAGNEFGATTGRPRRCGWVDMPALKYACMLNGVTQLAITKVDVLNTFDRIEACTHYRHAGELTEELPFDLREGMVEPVYRDFPGWNCDLPVGVAYEDLPADLAGYIDFLEGHLDKSVSMISVGPEREQLIERKVLADPV